MRILICATAARVSADNFKHISNVSQTTGRRFSALSHSPFGSMAGMVISAHTLPLNKCRIAVLLQSCGVFHTVHTLVIYSAIYGVIGGWFLWVLKRVRNK
jgi:hypothetical protein